MSGRQTYISRLLFLFIPGVFAVERYDRTGCLNRTQNLLSSDNNFVSLNPNYFSPGTTFNNPLLTLQGCRVLCGSRWGPYPDDGPRLIEWIIPGILLVANMHFSPGGKRRYLMLAHTLGDPIDSLYRLLATIEIWDKSPRISEDFVKEQRKLHRRYIKNGKFKGQYKIDPNQTATIISSAARLFSSLDIPSFSTQLFSSLDIRKIPETQLQYRSKKLHQASRALRLQRTHDIRRTGFAILLYIVQIVAVFVPAVGGSPNPSGGKVSPAMLLVWLLPLVVLSNAIGDYNCWELSQEALLEFLDSVQIDYRKFLDQEKGISANGRTRDPFVTERACTGTVLHSSPFTERKKVVLGAISVLPVIMACFTAFAVDYTGPSYFSCRATSIYITLFLWLLSCVITQILCSKLARYKHLWLYILVKDILILTPILVLILVSTCGWFNSCYCSSGAIFRGRERAQVVLDPEGFYWVNNHVIYPATVTVGILLQLGVAALVRWVQRRGFGTMWWDGFDEGKGLVKPELVGDGSGFEKGGKGTVVCVREIKMDDRSGSAFGSSRSDSFEGDLG